MTSPIVINIPGAKLLSSELSKNARIDPRKKARITAHHRNGSNARAAEYMGATPGFRCTLGGYYRNGDPMMLVQPEFRVRHVTLTRFAHARYSADGDNLSTLLSSVRDGVADALGVNDKVFVDNPTESDIQSGKIGITYKQIDGPWGLRIEIEPA